MLSPVLGVTGKAAALLGFASACLLVLGGCGGPSAAAPGGLTVGQHGPTTTPVPDVPDAWTPDRSGNVIYLTFDDGPGKFTPVVLDILKENDAKATFFEIGQLIRTREALAQRVLDEGHMIGDHTWNHSALARLSKAQIRRQLATTAQAIGPKMGPCMRPPYGSIDGKVRETSKSMGMTPILWTNDTHDFARKTTAAEIGKALENLTAGAVVLMHDGGGDRTRTMAALKEALPKLKAKGFTFETIPACRPL